MLMPKANRVAIYEHLFKVTILPDKLKKGVMIAENDLFLPKHPELPNVPNLHVIKTMQSLRSRNFVEQNFAWRHYYWRLTNDGIQYLRDYLHLPAEIVPATLKKPSRPADSRIRQSAPRSEPSREGGYRKMPDKAGDAGPGASTMEFRGGFGRGSRRPQ